MTQQTIYVRTTRAKLREAIAAIPRVARSNGATAQAMMVRCGMTALGRIKQAFIVKARGGTDDAGDSWPKLSPKTIAYSRRHPGVPKAAQRAASRPSYALTDKQRDQWWEYYRRGLAMFKGDKASAAKRAWVMSKASGATTLLDKYGSAQVDILRDTGLLLNSLSPGVVSPEQVFHTGPGEVIVGTNRKGARAHHEGIPGRLPQRRLWPMPSKWPYAWWRDINEQARAGLVDIAVELIRGAS